MKKLMALLLASAVLLSFASCGKKDMTAEEYSEYMAAEESKKAVESEKAEELVSEKMDDVSDDLGKTIKGKKLVVKKVDSVDTRYRVIMMDKKGMGDYMVTYIFANNDNDYNVLYNAAKNDKDLYKHDKDGRMIANRTDEIPETDFEDFYEGYKLDSAWEIIE